MELKKLVGTHCGVMLPLVQSADVSKNKSTDIFNPHQRCGYSDSPFARIYFFKTAGSRNRFEGMEAVCRHTETQKTISKGHFFLMEKYFEDLRQDEKHVPDLLESIMKPTDPVTEELWPMLFKITQIISKNTKSGFQLFGFQKSKVIVPEANASLLASKF